MASLVKKIIRGNAYYYARESQRVNGKPKVVRQIYLGRADDIVAKLQLAASAPAPQATVRDFGAVAALFDLARRLQLAGIIDRHIPKRGPGPSVGTYLLVAVLNRCLDPRSKSAIAPWFQRTVLDRLLPLAPTHYPDLLATPPSELRDLGPDGLPGVRARRVTRAIYGVERTVVVTYNENLFAAQARTLERLSAKRERRLSELAGQLGRWRDGQVQGGRPPSVQGVTKKINGWLRARHMRDLFSVEIGERDGLPTLAHAFNEPAWQQLRTTLLGKTLLFTDNHDWSDADIVRGYRAQHHVEGAFRQMKRPQRIALRPQYHWTDQKIEVHVFCCVLALLLTSLLQRDLRRRGLDRSLDALFEQLGTIREVGLLHPPHGSRRKPRLERVVSSMSEDQRALYEALDLQRYMDS